MEKEKIVKNLCTVPSFSVSKILRQHWNNETFSYRNTPRQDHGWMLLCRGEVTLRWKKGDLIAKAGDLVYLPCHCRYEAIFKEEAEDYLINFETEEDVFPPKRSIISDASSRV